MTMRTCFHDDRGSVPLALLVVIVLGSVSALLLSSVVTTQSSTAFDRDFAEAVQVADAGVQEGLVRLNSGAPLTSGTPFTGSVDGDAYEVTPTLLGPNEWEFTSTAEVQGVDRTVTVTTKEVPLYGFALYARNGVAFNGANAADSYNESAWCTGNGIVGTDGSLNFDGLAPAGSCHALAGFNKVSVDGAVLYDCGADDAATCGATRCTHSGGQNCTSVDSTMTNGQPGRMSARADAFKLTPSEELERIRNETAVCEAAGWNDQPPNGVADSTPGHWLLQEGDVLTPRSAATGRDFYCVSSLRFTDDTTVDAGSGDVRIVVKETIEVEGTRTTVNCPGCTSNDPYRNPPPDATALQIHGINMTSFMLSDPQQMFAAGVYAPNALCEGPAGADIYGSLICQLVDNVGSWNFHYDDRLDAAGGTGVWAIDRYREDA